MNDEKKIRRNRIILSIPIYVLFLVLAIVFVNEKRNFHFDEIMTFVLSNNTKDEQILVFPDWLTTYEEPSEVWLDRVSVQKDNRFDIANVWEKQIKDNCHPPFYYLAVNFVSSLVPGVFSKWIGGAVNIIFGLITLFFYRKILRYFVNDEWFLLIASLAFVFSAGILSPVTFFRMYMMAMLFVTATCYVLLKGLKKTGFPFYICLFLCSWAGTLTHYYYFVYLVPASVLFLIYLLIKKDWKALLGSVATWALAGGAVYLTYPYIIGQTIGGGYRGVEVLDNLVNSNFISRIKECYKIVNNQLFGGFFHWILLLCGILFLTFVLIRKNRKNKPVEEHGKGKNPGKYKAAVLEHYAWAILLLPLVFYFFAVAKVTIYFVDRYFFPVYALLLAGFSGILFFTLRFMLKQKKIPVYLILTLVLILTTFRNFRTSFYYLYRSTGPLITFSKEHPQTDCIFVFNDVKQITSAMAEVSNFDSVIFVPDFELSQIEELDKDVSEGLVFVLGNCVDINAVKEIVKKTWPSLNGFTECGGHEETYTCYFYHSEDSSENAE